MQSVAAILGGEKVFKRPVSSTLQMRELVRSGLPYSALESVLDVLGMQSKQIVELLGIAPRTLARRKEARQLNALESDRLYRIASVLHLASEVLGSIDKGRKWLSRPNRALAQAEPLSLLDTEIGRRQVEDVLNRINFGIYS